jgi:hypothetical protein
MLNAVFGVKHPYHRNGETPQGFHSRCSGQAFGYFDKISRGSAMKQDFVLMGRRRDSSGLANDIRVIYSWNVVNFVALEEREIEFAATINRAAWRFSDLS